MRSRSRLPGLANLVTSTRAVLAVPGFFFALRSDRFAWLVGVVLLAGLSDLLDGWVARRFDQPTRFGAALDPVVDGAFFGSVAAGLAVGGAYPDWLAVVVVLRYLLPLVVGGVLAALGRLPSLRHTFFGQLSTALIAVLIGGAALLRGVGLSGREVVLAGEVVIPLVTLLAWVDLARTARDIARPRATNPTADPPTLGG